MTSHTGSVHPQWLTDLQSHALQKSVLKIVDPPGYSSSKEVTKSTSKERASDFSTTDIAANDALKLKKAWEIATANVKSIFINIAVFYFSGNSIQLFSITMLTMFLRTPVVAIINTRTQFAHLYTDRIRGDMIKVQAVYVFINLFLLSMGIYKMHKMGILPTARSDWLAWETERQPRERAYLAWS